MIFKNKQFKSQAGKDNLIMSLLLSNAFKSVKYQLSTPPINFYAKSSSQSARCRLNLYSMNTGIIEYLLFLKLSANAKLYIYNLRKNLVEVICHTDPEILENIKNLISDMKLYSEIEESMINSDQYDPFSKRDLLENYLINRIHAYYYAASLKMKLLSNSGSRSKDFNLKDFPITKLFCKDSFNNEIRNISEFSTKFSFNIARRSIRLFSDEVEEIFASAGR